MISKELSEGVYALADKEFEDACKVYPLFHSPHEAAAVIREEFEEAQEDMQAMEIRFDKLWLNVREDAKNEKIDTLRLMMAAKNCACECIQVMAMCRKEMESIKRDEYDERLER